MKLKLLVAGCPKGTDGDEKYLGGIVSDILHSALFGYFSAGILFDHRKHWRMRFAQNLVSRLEPTRYTFVNTTLPEPNWRDHPEPLMCIEDDWLLNFARKFEVIMVIDESPSFNAFLTHFARRMGFDEQRPRISLEPGQACVLDCRPPWGNRTVWKPLPLKRK